MTDDQAYHLGIDFGVGKLSLHDVSESIRRTLSLEDPEECNDGNGRKFKVLVENPLAFDIELSLTVVENIKHDYFGVILLCTLPGSKLGYMKTIKKQDDLIELLDFEYDKNWIDLHD